jgi:hypothetical protein
MFRRFRIGFVHSSQVHMLLYSLKVVLEGFYGLPILTNSSDKCFKQNIQLRRRQGLVGG